MLSDVCSWVLIHRPSANQMRTLEHREIYRKIVTKFDPSLPTKVGEALPFLFIHVLAVFFVHGRDCRVPAFAANRVCLTAAIASRISL